MSKLIFADLPRVFKSRLLCILLILVAVMAAASVFTIYVEEEEKQALFMLASNNIILFVSMLMPIFAGGLSIILISAEFSSGVIRNKIIMGHSRKDILLSWTVIYSLITLLTYIVYMGTFFISLAVAGADFSTCDAGTVVTNILILFLFILKFQMFSMLMVCIYPDAKNAVIVYILNSMLNLPVMLLSMSENGVKVTKALSKVFLAAYSWADGFNLDTEPEKPWLTVVCILALSAVYLILADVYFTKKDLK